MRQVEATQVWWLFLAIFVLSAPLIALGWRSDVQLLPGLPISALMVLSIAAAAVMVAFRVGGSQGMVDLLRDAIDLRSASPAWYVAAILLMPGVLLVEYGVMRAFASLPPQTDVDWGSTLPLFAVFTLAAVLEEIAWTGVALEPLRARWGALAAALIIGVVWALLHALPYAQTNPLPWVLGQCAFSIVFRVVLVWLFVSTNGSLPAVILCHTAYNTAWQLFPGNGSRYDPWIAAAVTCVLGIALLAAAGPPMFRPNP